MVPLHSLAILMVLLWLPAPCQATLSLLRSLQSGGDEITSAKFKMSYQANFTYLRDENCQGPDPTIRLFCRGGLSVTGSSDNSVIQCGSQQVAFDVWNSTVCTVNCATDDCRRRVFLNEGGSNIDVGPFGSIFFDCFGNITAEMDAAVGYQDSGDGFCDIGTDARNFHYATLGINCPTSSGRQYIVDDRYTDCDTASVYSLDGLGSSPGNEQGCLQGRACASGTSCTTDFDDFFINVDEFLATGPCAITDVPIPSIELTPPLTPRQGGMTVQFRAEFGMFSPQQQCRAGTPKIRMSCPDGAITLINTTKFSTECQQLSSTVLECTDSISAEDRFTGVYYNCTGRENQTTVVEYPSTEASCDGNTASSSVSQKLQLGVVCDIEEEVQVVFNYNFIECGDVSSRFQYLDEFGESGGDETRYTCSEDAMFAAGSTSAIARRVPTVSMETDLWWKDNALPECFTIIDLPAESQDSSSSSLSLGPIIGGVVGGIAAICIAVVAFFYLKSRKTNHQNQPTKQEVVHTETREPVGPARQHENVLPHPHAGTRTVNSYPTSGAPASYPNSGEPASTGTYRMPVEPPSSPPQRDGHRHARRQDAYVPQFKDQSRSVTALPIASATPVVDNDDEEDTRGGGSSQEPSGRVLGDP